MKQRNRAQRAITIAGTAASQAGLFVLVMLLIYGLYTLSWEHAAGWPPRICWIAWIVAGMLLVLAGGRTWIPGVAQTIGGIIGFIAASEFEEPSAAMLALQGAAALICVGSYVANLTRFLPEKLRIPCNVANTTFLAVCLVASVNAISMRTYGRYDWTSAGFYELSRGTADALAGLDESLKITVFMRPEVTDEYERPTENPIYDYTHELLQRMRSINPAAIEVEWFDPDWDRRRVEVLLEKYGVARLEVERSLGVIVLEYGESHKYVTSRDMADIRNIYDPSLGRPTMRRLTAFKGEAALMGSLKGLMEGKTTKLCFLTGHGEKNIAESDPEKGLPSLARTLYREDLAVESLQDPAISGIPEDCDVLVVAGPRRPLSRDTLRIIKRYFSDGGNIILLLDPLAKKGTSDFAPSGFEPMLEEWGLKIHNDIVTLRIPGTRARVYSVPVSAQECYHRIVDELREEKITFSLDCPRSMEITGRSATSGLSATALARTFPQFWGETDLDSYREGTDEKTEDDNQGVLVVAAAIQETGESGEVIPRAVVIGDSDFITDDMLTGGNLDLFMNSVNWLSGSPIRQQMMGIAPKEPERVKLDITPVAVAAVALPIAIGTPLAVLLFGAVVWWTRRR